MRNINEVNCVQTFAQTENLALKNLFYSLGHHLLSLDGKEQLG